MAREIDWDYFEHYGGPHIPYTECWQHYSFVDECVALLRKLQLYKVKKIAILGVASGEPAMGFRKRDNYEVYGCENFRPVYDQIPDYLKKTIAFDHMENYTLHMPIVDLVFSNSLCYLDSIETIERVIIAAGCKSQYFYHEPPTLKYPDAYRVIEMQKQDWNKVFSRCGFTHVSGYLWKSQWKEYKPGRYGCSGLESTMQKIKAQNLSR